MRKRRRQVVVAQEVRDRLRHVGGGGHFRHRRKRRLGLRPEQREPLRARDLSALPGSRPWARAPGGRPRSAARIVSLPVTPSERRMLARMSSRALMRTLPLRSRCQRAWKVSPCGAGKSRYFVQPLASGSHAKRPRAAAGKAESAHGDAGREPVEGRALGEEAPELEAGAHRRRRQVPLEFALAPMAHELRQRDAHRAHALAAPAEGRGVGQVARPCRRRSAMGVSTAPIGPG